MRWNDGLVNAFPVPLEKLSLKQVAISKSIKNDLTVTTLPSAFPFFDLPSELRNRIYSLVLFSKAPHGQIVLPRKQNRISVLLACKRCHEEAAYVLYTTVHFRVFPLQDFGRAPTVRDLPAHYRKMVTNIEMTLGSSWTGPPASWRVTKYLAKRLATLNMVQTLKIFVQIDPSHPTFEKYRISETFYTDFCGKLLEAVLNVMPQIESVELDGNPSVDLQGPLVSRLQLVAVESKRYVKWGKRGAAEASKAEESISS